MIELKVIAENAHMLRGELRGLGYWHENDVAEEIARHILAEQNPPLTEASKPAESRAAPSWMEPGRTDVVAPEGTGKTLDPDALKARIAARAEQVIAEKGAEAIAKAIENSPGSDPSVGLGTLIDPQPHKKRGRPRKVVAQEADDTPVPFAEPKVVDENAAAAAAEEHSPYGVVDLPACRRAINAVAQAKGMPAAIKVVSHFGVKKVSELPEARWTEFYEHCERVVKGELG